MGMHLLAYAAQLAAIRCAAFAPLPRPLEFAQQAHHSPADPHRDAVAAQPLAEQRDQRDRVTTPQPPAGHQPAPDRAATDARADWLASASIDGHVLLSTRYITFPTRIAGRIIGVGGSRLQQIQANPATRIILRPSRGREDLRVLSSRARCHGR